MTTLVLESVPDELHEALKSRARRNHRSLTSEVIACLEEVLPPAQRDATSLLARIRASREDLRRSGIAGLTDEFLSAAKEEGRRR